VGNWLPISHIASVEYQFEGISPETLFKIIEDVKNYPLWKPKVQKLELISDTSNTKVWKEVDSRGRTVIFEMTDRKEYSFLKTSVSKKLNGGLPFGGYWTFQFVGLPGNSTKLITTEYGDIYNSFFRFISYYFIGHSTSLRKFISALKEKLKASK